MSTSPEKRSSSSDLTTSSAAADVNTDDAQQFQQIIRDRKDEREDVQKKAFTKWINNQLANTSSTPAINDLFQDLRDGVVLLRLLEVLTGNEYKRENGKMRVHHIGNVNKVISILNEHGIKLLSISSNDIVDGNPKLTLAVIWAIIQYWQGKDVIKSVEPDVQQTNIEKFLLSWCQEQTKGYKGVQVNDFTRSWQDGLAFNALIHRYRPDLFDYEELLQNTAARNLEHAFSLAKNVFKTDRYLDVEDVTSDFPDKKSIMMYVMCLFQQLPSSNIVIEDKEKTTTTDDDHQTMETKSPSNADSTELITYQTNMERILRWILNLEEELVRQDNTISNDLKVIKEQFQSHEEFMISLTQDQNQIGDVLQQATQVLATKELNLTTDQENQIKEQMKTLNQRWESLRSKSLDRQTILHKTLMKLQIEQIESFDTWLSQTEERISKNLELLEDNPSGIEQQYQQLAQLQDELVAQQQTTESLQNMIIVIDDSSSNDEYSSTKYNSTNIENNLLNLSERWANICNFVQNRWIELQEIKVLFEQMDSNRNKVEKWLTVKEIEINQMKSETNLNNSDVVMEQVNTIQKIETEMDDIRQSILSLDNGLKMLSTHYDTTKSTELKNLNEQINTFEKRWTNLIDDLEQCSTRLKNSNLTIEVNGKRDNDDGVKPNKITTTTTIEETTTTNYENEDDSTNKKQKTEHDNTIKSEFDISARKYIDWIDNIERILEEKSTELHKRQDIIQEIKTKYNSYDDQFKTLIQTGYAITKQLQDANEDSTEHEAFVKTLETRWQDLHTQITKTEKELEQSIVNNEIEELDRIRTEYQTWIDEVPSSTSTSELQVKLKTFQTYNERLTNLRRMADRLDQNAAQRTDELLRSWDETQSRLRTRSIPVEHMQQQQQTSGTATSTVTSYRQTGSSSVPASPNRAGTHDQSTSSTATTTATTTNLNPSIGENGSVFTLTNIYTFGGGDSNPNIGSNDLSSDKYRVKSFVEVFDQPSSSSYKDSEYERHYRETHSSSKYSRKIRTSETDTYDYGDNGLYDSSRYQHHYERTSPATTRYIYDQRSTGTGDLSLLPSIFTDTQRTVRLWLEHVEQSLLNDKIRIVDIHSINVKKKVLKDLIDQTFEQENNLERLYEISREYSSKLSIDANRRLQQELDNYKDRLNDVKMWLNKELTEYYRIEKTLVEFESSVEEVRNWIRNAQPRITTTDTSARGLETQLSRNQALQQEIRDMQITINRLNKDVVDLTQNADESLARRLRDEMQRLNESWSHIISSTKVYSQNIQDTLRRNRIIQEEIRELEDWIADKDRETIIDDGSIFYQDQLRERLEQYQRLQTELNLKEYTVRTLVDQVRLDINQAPSSTTELSHSLDSLISNWSNLQKKVDNKLAFYTDVYKLHEELKDLLQRETHWLDTLENKIYSTVQAGADAEETSEELDSLERFVKTHSKSNYERILEISDRLQTAKVSIPTTLSHIKQFHIRWEQLHEDALKKTQLLNSQIADYQQLGQQITAMFEWMRHTDNTLNARLKDDVYADDVPGEAEKLIVEFNQYETFLRTVEDRIHTLRTHGKTDAARRLEQQYVVLKNQFLQLQNKFRQFQKPSDFEPKYNKMRQILHDVEQNIHTLEIRSDEPDVIHNQLEHCLKLYKTLADIKSDVEYVIRVGRGIVERRQTIEGDDLTRQIDQLKTTYNNLGARVSTAKTQLDNVERHLRKFRKEYSHIHEWFVKADHEIRKIENKQISKNIKEEIDWIRTTRNDIKKLDANFETLRTLERNIQKETERPLPGLHEKITELRRQIDQLDRRLRDRGEIVEGQVRKLDTEYERFSHIYQEIIIRLDKLETLLSDAERVLDVTRIQQVQDELRSVRIQLDDMLNLGQELVSKSEKYNKLVGPDIENITRKFEELQRRIYTIQEKRIRDQQTTTTTTTTTNNNIQDDQRDDVRREYFTERRYNRTERETRRRSPSESSDISTTHGVIDDEFKKKYLRCLAYMKLIERLYENQQETDDDTDVKHRRTSRRERTIRDRPEYEEIERIIRETEERALIIEKTDVEQARRIREKIRRLRDGLESLKSRSEHYEANDEVVRYNERYEEHIRTTDRTVPKERELDSDFIYDIDDTRSVISEPVPQFNKYRKTVHSLERFRADDQGRYIPTHEEYQLQPLLRVRSLKAIDHRTLSAPSSPILQPRYRSYERSNVQYTKQSSNQQGQQDNYQSSISKSASMPNGGFPLQQNLLPHPPPPPNFYPQQPMTYRERIIDKHVAERSTSRGESHRQQHQESSGHVQQQQQQQQQQQARSSSAVSGQTQTINRSIPVRYESSSSSAAANYRQANGYQQEQYPNYFYNEQHSSGRQQPYPPQNVGRHPTRIVN